MGVWRYKNIRKHVSETTLLTNAGVKHMIPYLYEEIANHKEFYNKLCLLLESKETSNPPIIEVFNPINTIAIKGTTKFTINPSLEEAPGNLLATLNSRLLDLSVVRAEIALLCFDNLLNISLPVHVFLLANYEQDFRVSPPTLKTLIYQLQQQKYKFLRHKYSKKSDSIRWLFKKNRMLLFSYTAAQFFRIVAKRISALVERDDDDEVDVANITSISIQSLVRVEIGTLRTLKCLLIGNINIYKTAEVETKLKLEQLAKEDEEIIEIYDDDEVTF
jgi:hypothetical protein